MTDFGNDEVYVVARRVLLDALDALAAHREALVVVGAQAVYLRTESDDLTVAPYTTDGDLALDPTLLEREPELERAMRTGDFALTEIDGHTEPGVWYALEEIGGEVVKVPVDLIVPEGVAPPGGRRGARLGTHGKSAARRAEGLEAALVDNTVLSIRALETHDDRIRRAKVAGIAGLFVAKLHKIHDRVGDSRADRQPEKDAADVVRMMRVASPAAIAADFSRLRMDPIAGQATERAMEFASELFARRTSIGTRMAVQALRLAVDEREVQALCESFTRRVLDG